MVVYTVGTFDMLHVGHLALLERCRTLGAVVAVGVASDSVVTHHNWREIHQSFILVSQ